MDGVEIFLPSVFNIFNKQCLFSLLYLIEALNQLAYRFQHKALRFFQYVYVLLEILSDRPSILKNRIARQLVTQM